MGRADALAIASGTSGRVLMERAGQCVAQACLEMLEGRRGRVAVLCGPGNNGGDGFVCARHLAEAGCDVRLALLGRLDLLRGDAAEAAAAWTGAVVPPAEISLADVDLVVDALFGAGLSRPLEGEARALVERVNAARRPVLAVDVPSGVDGATGQVRGVAIDATTSATFFRFKRGTSFTPRRALRAA